MKAGCKFNEHRVQARLEDAQFLLDLGEPLDRVAKRLGVSVQTLEKQLERSR